MNLVTLKQCLPPSLRAAARDTWSARAFQRALHRLMVAPPERAPDRALLQDLRDTWGNEGFSADLDFLVETARRAVKTRGPVLECGSGLTTVLLGVLAGRRWVDVWSLEHDRTWYERVARVLRRHRIPGVHLCFAPLGSYGAFTWYAPPLAVLPARFGLVVCDGPPETTSGGRYGLLPVLRDRLAAGTVILLDDAARESEFKVLERWSREASLHVQLQELPAGTYARIEVAA